MTARYFVDRSRAEQLLAESLKGYAGKPNVLVLGLPRGGIPVAYEVARAIKAPLDMVSRAQVGNSGS